MTTVTPNPTTPETDWAPFRLLLQTRRAECLREHELALAETVTSVPDAVAMSRAARLLDAVEEIDAALERIDTGTYGRCVHCGSDLPLERLEFRPFAAGCVACQQRVR